MLTRRKLRSRAMPSGAKIGGDFVRAIFADGTDGFYFDLTKTDRTWQAVNNAVLADDASELIGLAFEGSKWDGRLLDAELSTLTDKITNGDNESALFTSAYGSVGGTNGTVAQSADFASSGTKSAKFLCNTASSVAHYITAGLIPANTAIYVRGKVYVPTGSLATFKAVDINDGSWIPSLTTTKDQWVSFVAARAAKATSWNLAFGNNDPQSINGQAFYIDDLEIYAVPGNHGQQATSGARPSRQAGGLARFDGSDDNLLTTLNPAASFSVMFKGKVTSASKIVMGSRASTDTRFFLGTDASGLLAGGVGAQDVATIKGGSDIRATVGVGALVCDGATVTLYWNGSPVYSGALSGSINTTIPLRLGAFNDNGSAGSFADADIYHALAIKKALSAAQVAAITKYWRT